VATDIGHDSILSEYQISNWKERALRAERILDELRTKIDSTVYKDAVAKVDGK
jgi:hypothetical protein